MQRDDQVEAMVNRALARPKVYCQDCQFLRWSGLTLERARTRVCGHPHALVRRETSFAPDYERLPLEVRNAHNDCPDFERHDGVSSRTLSPTIRPLLVVLMVLVALASAACWLWGR